MKKTLTLNPDDWNAKVPPAGGPYAANVLEVQLNDKGDVVWATYEFHILQFKAFGKKLTCVGTDEEAAQQYASQNVEGLRWLKRMVEATGTDPEKLKEFEDLPREFTGKKVAIVLGQKTQGGFREATLTRVFKPELAIDAEP